MIFAGDGDDIVIGGADADRSTPARVATWSPATARGSSRRRPTRRSYGDRSSRWGVFTTIAPGIGGERPHRHRVGCGHRARRRRPATRSSPAPAATSSSATTARSTTSIDGDPSDLDLIESLDPELGGTDTILTGEGDDVVIGGAGGRRRSTPARVATSWSATTPRRSRRPSTRRSSRAWPMTFGFVNTTAPEIGGDDAIVTGAGADIVLGGAGSDMIDTGAGDDLVLGDNAASLDRSTTIRPTSTSWQHRLELGGGDTIFARDGDDVVIGGTGDDNVEGGNGRDRDPGRQRAARTRTPRTPRSSAITMTIRFVKSVVARASGARTRSKAGEGDDIVIGGAGIDVIDAGRRRRPRARRQRGPAGLTFRRRRSGRSRPSCTSLDPASAAIDEILHRRRRRHRDRGHRRRRRRRRRGPQPGPRRQRDDHRRGCRRAAVRRRAA